jgi:hypothetical protein
MLSDPARGARVLDTYKPAMQESENPRRSEGAGAPRDDCVVFGFSRRCIANSHRSAASSVVITQAMMLGFWN